jgi:hypothetical protein
MKKFNLIVLIVICFQFIGQTQYSAGGGYTYYKSLNSPITWQGIQAFVEFPRTESNTFFLRASYMFPKRLNDSINVTAFAFTTSPQQLEVDRLRKSSFFSIDGGNRTYFMNTYDAGIAPYFSSHARGIFGTYSESYGDYDETKYEAPNDFSKATSLLIGMGINLGVKYQLPYRGALTFDIGAEYVLALYDAAQFMGNELTPISVFANVSYRVDWY